MNSAFRIISILLFCLYSSSLSAVDLFGSEQLKEGELPLAEQKSLYEQFFENAEKAATSSSKRLDLALELKTQVQDPKYDAMRRYMLQRMKALCDDSKKKEAYELQLYAFNEEHKDREPSHLINVRLIQLLEKLLKKSSKSEALVLAKEISALHNVNAQMSLAGKKYEQAKGDYKELSSWLKKCRDKGGADLAKKMIGHIDDYLDDKEDFEEALEGLIEKPDDIKLAAKVGRFYVLEGDWKSAHPYLESAGQSELAAVALLAQDEEADLNKQGQNAVNLGKVLSDRSIKRDEALYRKLLMLGMYYKKNLDSRADDLGPAMKIKYTLASEAWSDALDKLGPDPLEGFEVGDASASVDETRLVRMGWISLFDHKTVGVERTPNDIADGTGFEVKDGIIIMKKTGPEEGVELDNFPEIELAKAVKIRFRFVGENSYAWFTFSGEKTWTSKVARICIRQDRVGFSQTYGSEGGVFTLRAGEWNDVTITIDGKVARASFNGEDYPNSIPFPHEQIWHASISMGGIKEDLEMHIQSIMVLKK